MSSNEDAERDDNEHEELIQHDGVVYYYDPKFGLYHATDTEDEPFVLSDYTYGERNSEEKEKDKKRKFPVDEKWAFPADKKKSKEKTFQDEDAYEDQSETDVYVFQLPSDVTKDEDPEGNPYVNIFINEKLQCSKKTLRGGKIQSSMRSGGVALVRYAWASSIHLALQHLDGKPLRPGGTVLMSVEQNGGSDDSKENVAIVVLKNMFTLKEIEEDINLPHELENYITLECSKLGALKSVKVYENDPEGVIEVKYKNRKDAIKWLLLHRTFGVGEDPNEHDKIGRSQINWKSGLCNVESRSGPFDPLLRSDYSDSFLKFLRNPVPRPLRDIKISVIPVLLSYHVGAREPYAQFYSPAERIILDRPLSGIRINDFNLIAHNSSQCEMLLVNPLTREVCIYILDPDFSKDRLVRITNLPVVKQHPYKQFGCFARYVTDEGEDDERSDDAKYEILIFDFLREALNYNCIRTFRKVGLSENWKVDDYFWGGVVLNPTSPLTFGNIFMWVNQWDGAIFILEDWKDPTKQSNQYVRFKPLQDCQFVFGLVHHGRPVFVARTIAVYEFSFCFDRDERKVSRSAQATNARLMRLEDLSGYTFFGSRMHQGFSGLIIDEGRQIEENCIVMGGFRGDCCTSPYDPRLNMMVGHSGLFLDLKNKINTLREETALVLDILQTCHAARRDSHPFDCTCECAFFEVPLIEGVNMPFLSAGHMSLDA